MASSDRFGPLREDPDGVLDLPAEFRYRVISRAGDEMDDGLLVPPRADGMAAFAAADGGDAITLVCNHENHPARPGAFGPGNERLERLDRKLLYDAGGGLTPGTGGTTTTVFDPATGEVRSRRLSLAGTEVNCAGGKTPWGSWLSCEECFESPGVVRHGEREIRRERRHGYVFEVPLDGPATAKPLEALGRFEHEAAAVDPGSGIVYLSEDRSSSLLYRFLADVPGRLAAGGRLQALVLTGRPSYDTRNWETVEPMPVGDWYDAAWIDIEEPDPDANEMRFAGFADGAARFARGEGLAFADGSLFLTATTGGILRLGQVFEYRPYRNETRAAAGRLRLLAESGDGSLLRNADNLTLAPWQDLVICEDTAFESGLIGMTTDGRQYPLARNRYTRSELAGVCFAPNGKTMFLNIQDRGLTLAITGPW